MPTEGWITPPSFSDGEVLSATKLNILQEDIEVLAGLTYGREWPQESSGYPEQSLQTDAGADEYWRGWIAHHPDADTLCVYLKHTASSIDITYNGETLTTSAASGSHELDLSGITASLDDWYPYEIIIKDHGTTSYNSETVYGPAIVQWVYETGDTPSIGSMPAFTNDATSDVDDFNDLSDALTDLEPMVRQSVIGVRGHKDVNQDYYVLSYGDGVVSCVNVGSSSAYITANRWTIQHQFNRMYISARARVGAFDETFGGSQTSNPNNPSPWYLVILLHFRDITSGADYFNVWQKMVQTIHTSSALYPCGAGDISCIRAFTYWSDISEELTGLDEEGLEVGKWYDVFLEYSMYYITASADWDDPQPEEGVNYGNDFWCKQEAVFLRHWYEFAPRLPAGAGYVDMEPWEHGDVVDGDGSSNPCLEDMSTDIDILVNRMRFVNYAQRQIADTRMIGGNDEYKETVKNEGRGYKYTYHIRTHRYLVYKTAATPGETSLDYYSGGEEWTTVNVAASTASPAYLDLDSTPVLGGMTFRITGVDFAIQTPERYTT